MDVERAAPAVGVAQDAHPPGVRVGGVTAQRVLPGRRLAEDQVGVRARCPAGQRVAVGLAQGQGDHPVGDDLFGLDPDVGLELAGDQRDAGRPALDGLDVQRR